MVDCSRTLSGGNSADTQRKHYWVPSKRVSRGRGILIPLCNYNLTSQSEEAPSYPQLLDVWPSDAKRPLKFIEPQGSAQTYQSAKGTLSRSDGMSVHHGNTHSTSFDHQNSPKRAALHTMHLLSHETRLVRPQLLTRIQAEVDMRLASLYHNAGVKDQPAEGVADPALPLNLGSVIERAQIFIDALQTFAHGFRSYREILYRIFQEIKNFSQAIVNELQKTQGKLAQEEQTTRSLEAQIREQKERCEKLVMQDRETEIVQDEFRSRAGAMICALEKELRSMKVRHIEVEKSLSEQEEVRTRLIQHIRSLERDVFYAHQAAVAPMENVKRLQFELAALTNKHEHLVTQHEKVVKELVTLRSTTSNRSERDPAKESDKRYNRAVRIIAQLRAERVHLTPRPNWDELSRNLSHPTIDRPCAQGDWADNHGKDSIEGGTSVLKNTLNNFKNTRERVQALCTQFVSPEESKVLGLEVQDGRRQEGSSP